MKLSVLVWGLTNGIAILNVMGGDIVIVQGLLEKKLHSEHIKLLSHQITFFLFKSSVVILVLW